jgi:hypothetical protein
LQLQVEPRKEYKQDKEDKDMRQDQITNTTTVRYEDRAGAKYSHTKVLIVGKDEESNPDGPKLDAASPLSL